MPRILTKEGELLARSESPKLARELDAERGISQALADALHEILMRAGTNQGEWKDARAALRAYVDGL